MTQKLRSMTLFENYVHSPKTRALYSTLIKNFCKYHKIPTWDSMLQLETNKLKEKIEDYLIYLKAQERSHSHMRNSTFALQSYLESNDYAGLNWKKIRKILGRDEKSHNSRPYTTEEIKRMLAVSKSLRNRAMILFLSASGVRRGAIPEMKIKDLKQMTHGCIAVTVYANHRDQYTTFINREASEALSVYHERRKQLGEILTPESLVFPSVNSKKTTASITETTISMLIRRIKKTAGIGGNDDSNLLVHAFRRRFDTIFKLKDNANVSLVERLMGHSVSVQLDNQYFQPTIENLFAEYQKAMIDLTIDDSERLMVKLDAIEEEKSEFELQKQEQDSIKGQMNILAENQAKMNHIMNMIMNGDVVLVSKDNEKITLDLIKNT